MQTQKMWEWIPRGLIGFVFIFNVQCGLVFILSPQTYVGGFELSGPPGEAVVRGLGILFLMWNVPYAFALWQPYRNRHSLIEAVIMQAIGWTGETAIYASLEAGHAVAQQTLLRFIVFDGTGLIALLAAAWLVRRRLTEQPLTGN